MDFRNEITLYPQCLVTLYLIAYFKSLQKFVIEDENTFFVCPNCSFLCNSEQEFLDILCTQPFSNSEINAKMNKSGLLPFLGYYLAGAAEAGTHTRNNEAKVEMSIVIFEIV